MVLSQLRQLVLNTVITATDVPPPAPPAPPAGAAAPSPTRKASVPEQDNRVFSAGALGGGRAARSRWEGGRVPHGQRPEGGAGERHPLTGVQTLLGAHADAEGLWVKGGGLGPCSSTCSGNTAPALPAQRP